MKRQDMTPLPHILTHPHLCSIFVLLHSNPRTNWLVPFLEHLCKKANQPDYKHFADHHLSFLVMSKKPKLSQVQNVKTIVEEFSADKTTNWERIIHSCQPNADASGAIEELCRKIAGTNEPIAKSLIFSVTINQCTSIKIDDVRANTLEELKQKIKSQYYSEIANITVQSSSEHVKTDITCGTELTDAHWNGLPMEGVISVVVTAKCKYCNKELRLREQEKETHSDCVRLFSVVKNSIEKELDLLIIEGGDHLEEMTLLDAVMGLYSVFYHSECNRAKVFLEELDDLIIFENKKMPPGKKQTHPIIRRIQKKMLTLTKAKREVYTEESLYLETKLPRDVFNYFAGKESGAFLAFALAKTQDNTRDLLEKTKPEHSPLNLAKRLFTNRPLQRDHKETLLSVAMRLFKKIPLSDIPEAIAVVTLGGHSGEDEMMHALDSENSQDLNFETVLDVMGSMEFGEGQSNPENCPFNVIKERLEEKEIFNKIGLIVSVGHGVNASTSFNTSFKKPQILKKRVSTMKGFHDDEQLVVSDWLAAAVVIFTRHLFKTKSEFDKTNEKTVEVLLKYITILRQNFGSRKLPKDVANLLLKKIEQSLLQGRNKVELSEHLKFIIGTYDKKTQNLQPKEGKIVGARLGSIILDWELEFADEDFENMSSDQRLAVTQGYILQKIEEKMENLSAHRNPEDQLTISLVSFSRKLGTSASECQYQVSIRVSGDKLKGLELNSPQFKERSEYVENLLKDMWWTNNEVSKPVTEIKNQQKEETHSVVRSMTEDESPWEVLSDRVSPDRYNLIQKDDICESRVKYLYYKYLQATTMFRRLFKH